MRNVYISIMDKSGNAFTLYVSTPSTSKGFWDAYTKGLVWGGVSNTGSWKSMKLGFIRYNFGKTRVRSSDNGDATTRDLLILSPDGEGIKTYDGQDRFGMQLFEYQDTFGINDEGEGTVIQPWVLGISPGRIRWEKIEEK